MFSIIHWLIISFAVLIALAIDNVFWIVEFKITIFGKTYKSGSPEWTNPNYWPSWNWKQKIKFIIVDRFIQVLWNPVDIAAALTGGLILSFFI